MHKLLVGLILIHGSLAHAQLDEHQRKGLQNTQEKLRDKKARDEAIRENPRGKEVDAKVDALTGGGADKEQVYGLAAQVMEKIVAEAEGDPQKMQRLLMEAQTNPQAFYDKYFTAEQKAAVRGLAEKIEKRGTSVRSPK